MGYDTKAVRENVLAGHKRLIATLDGLTDADMRAPAALPDWSRAHVFTHLEHLAIALTRQAEFALAGKQVDLYDGGRPAARAAVNAAAGRSAAEIRDAVTETAAELENIWTRVHDWSLPVRYRDGVLSDTVLARWREL